MIGRLRGEVAEVDPPFLLLDVNGVGYELQAPLTLFAELPEPGGQATLHTHLAVRDDAHVLYAFASRSQRGLFRALLKVNGVGAKMALGILSAMSADEFARCLREENVAALVGIPGIGKKTAQRLIVEMRDRLEQSGAAAASVPGAGGAASRPETPVSDAVAALAALGYRPQDAAQMVKAVEQPGLGSDELIRAALQEAGRRR